MIQGYKEGVFIFKGVAFVWLAVATLLTIAGQVVHILGDKQNSQNLAGFAGLFLTAFAFFLLMSNSLADTANELEGLARRISHPFYPAAPRSTRHRWKIRKA